MLSFISSLVIARLLSPAEIGIYSISVAFIGVTQILRDFGATNYIIQSQSITRDILRSAFGSMLLLAWLLAGVLWMSASAISAFYSEPRLQELLHILSLNLLLTPMGAVTIALLRRNMRFGTIGLIDVTSTAVQSIVSCFLAWRGLGATSLAWGALSGLITTILLSLAHRQPEQSWLPGISHLREILGFGSYATSASLLGHLNISAADLLLGRLADSQAVGLFSRGISLARLLTTILMRGVNPVIGPLFAKLRRGEGDAELTFRNAAVQLTVLTWPALAFTAAFSEQIIHILFGSQWIASAPLVPFICVSTAIGIPFTMVSQVLLGSGKPRFWLKIEAMNLPIKLAAVFFAAPFGLTSVAASFSIVALCGATYQLHILKKHMGFRSIPLLRSWIPSLAVGLCCWLVFIGVRTVFQAHLSSFTLLVVAGIVGIPAWLAMVWLLRHPVWSEVRRLLALRTP